MSISLQIIGIPLLVVAVSSCSDTELLSGGSPASSGKAENLAESDPPNIEAGDEQIQRNFGDGALDSTITEPLSFEDQLIRGEGFDNENLECSGSNLVKNSDFERGNQDFTTTYVFQVTSTSGYLPDPAERITINSDPQANHRGYTNHADDSGQMLVINLAARPLRKFWCQKFNVKKDALYQISVRMRKAVGFDTVRSSLSEWLLDEEVFTQQFDPTGDWGKFLKTWVSPEDKQVELCGRNIAAAQETADLIVDDIRFVECE